MKANAEFSDVAIAVSIGAGAWFAAMPALKEVRATSSSDSDYCLAMRHTEVCVAILTISVGIIGSVMLKDKAPAIAAVATVAGLVVFYEATFRMNPNK